MTIQQPGGAFFDFSCSVRLLSIPNVFKRSANDRTMPFLRFVSDIGNELSQAGPVSFCKPRVYACDADDSSLVAPLRALTLLSAWRTAWGILLVAQTQSPAQKRTLRYWISASDPAHGQLCVWLARSSEAIEDQQAIGFSRFWRAHVLR